VSICAVAAGVIVSLLPRSNFAWVILDIALFGIAYLCLVIITGVFDRQSLKKIREDFAGTPDRG